MAIRQRTTTVQMPASPDLYPSHVVAIRPEVDGAWSDQGDYVLTVETPRGTRNVVASVDGVIEVHVELMQDLEPGSILFVIHPDDEPIEYDDVDYGTDEDPPSAPRRNIPPPAPPPSASVAAPKSRLGGLFWAYLVLCLVLAALWPGLVYAFHDVNGAPIVDLLVTASLWGAGLGALTILFGALPFFGGFKKTALTLFSSLVVFGASLAAGVLQPDIGELHQNGVVSAVRQVLPSNLQVAGKRLSVGQQASQNGHVVFPDLMAMLSAPVQPGKVELASGQKKQTSGQPSVNLRGGADYGPITELIARPFNRQ